MDQFSPRQLILTVIVVSVASSFLVSVLVVGLITGTKPSQVVQQIVREVPGGEVNEKEISERVLRQDELVVSAVKRASPAVVSIVATKDVPVVEQFFVNPFGSDPLFRQFFGDDFFSIPQFRQKGTQKQEVFSGTGFIVSPDGLILTNKHVVADTGADYTVFFNDGTKLPAKVLGRDPAQDLAVVRVDRGGLTTLELGDSSDIQIGQTVIAIGNALGEFRNTVSLGVVSGLHRSIVASGAGIGSEQLAELIQTDAAINPGNSGGPLLNLRGEVIAINVAMAQGAENIGFAIPINKAKRDIESVKAVGRIVYPFLGVRYIPVTRALQIQRGLAVDYGALIEGDASNPGVVPGSPAEKAGIKAKDIILEMQGERVSIEKPLAELIQQHRVGETVTLKILRGSDMLTVSATLEERR